MYRNSPFFATKSGKSSPFDMGWRACSDGERDHEKELSSEALCSSLPGPWLLWTRNATPSTKPGILPVTGHWVRHQGLGFALIYRGVLGCVRRWIWVIWWDAGESWRLSILDRMIPGTGNFLRLKIFGSIFLHKKFFKNFWNFFIFLLDKFFFCNLF